MTKIKLIEKKGLTGNYELHKKNYLSMDQKSTFMNFQSILCRSNLLYKGT